VLDNCEHVLDAATLVAELLSSVPALRLLGTSRAPFRMRGERLYTVGPLELDAGADVISPADLSHAPAVRLFVERVRDVEPAFRLTLTNAGTVTAICRRLDALPLALELAAPWLKVLTLDDLLQRLERDVLLPPAGPRDLPERQKTMNATVAWSYQLLDRHEQRAFRRLAALPGRFPIEAAAAVLGDTAAASGADETLAATAALIDKSLLHRVETIVEQRPCTTCSKRCAGSRPSSSPRRARPRRPARRWRAIVWTRPRAPNAVWSAPIKSCGWIGCVMISTTTGPR